MRTPLIMALACLMSMTSWAAEKRIVIAGGTLTDIAYALNAGQQVVAVDTSSTWPAAVHKLPKVGYYRDLAAEGVLAQQPDLMLALEGSGREQVLKHIQSAGVTLKLFPKPKSVDDLFDLIHKVAEVLDSPSEAAPLIAQLKQQLPAKPQAGALKALFLMSASDRGLVAAGTETVPDIEFSYAGISNLAKHQGYKTISREYLIMANPDFLVAPKHVVQSVGGKQAFCQQSALALLPAAKRCDLLVMDSLMAMGMTTRLPQAIRLLSEFSVKL